HLTPPTLRDQSPEAGHAEEVRVSGGRAQDVRRRAHVGQARAVEEGGEVMGEGIVETGGGAPFEEGAMEALPRRGRLAPRRRRNRGGRAPGRARRAARRGPSPPSRAPGRGSTGGRARR